MSLRYLLLAAALLALSGCASAPVLTLEERLDSDYAKRPFPRERLEADIPYHVNLVFAHAAWELIDDPNLPRMSGIDTQSTLEVPLAVFDYFTVGSGPALAGLLFSFGTRDAAQDYRGYLFHRGMQLTAEPNTNYYLFDDTEGPATPEDVDFAWDQAYQVFNSVYNRDGRCYANFWTPETGYARVRPINARGVKKEVEFRCTHALYPDGPDQLITVQAMANPFDGIRAVGAVQARCWVQLPQGSVRFRDYRDCGERLATRQRPLLPETKLPLMELITTPTAADPTEFQVVARFGERVTSFPAPRNLTEEHLEFLATQPFSVDD